MFNITDRMIDEFYGVYERPERYAGTVGGSAVSHYLRELSAKLWDEAYQEGEYGEEEYEEL